MIDYSAIPESKIPASPWVALKWAVLVTFSIIATMGLGALVGSLIGHTDGIMQFIGLVGVAGLFGLVIAAFIKGSRGFSSQKQWMRNFAKANNWYYAEGKRTISDLAAYPPAYINLASRWNNVRCTVSGDLNGSGFELAHITYMQSTGLIGLLSDTIGRKRFAWTSVLRIEGHPVVRESTGLVYEKDELYTYVVCGLNALYQHDVKAMFQSINTW